MDQLTQLRYTFTPRGQMKLESKEDMRKRRLGSHVWQSPDRADSLALCFAGAARGYTPTAFAGLPRATGAPRRG